MNPPPHVESWPKIAKPLKVNFCPPKINEGAIHGCNVKRQRKKRKVLTKPKSSLTSFPFDIVADNQDNRIFT